jgi:hypothetical protein
MENYAQAQKEIRSLMLYPAELRALRPRLEGR